jgi:hypothetical protein
MRTKTFIWLILTIFSFDMFAQQHFSDLEMMGVKFAANENLLICENLENSSKTIIIIESEVAKSSYATITYKFILKKKEVIHYNLNIIKGKLDVSITEYYGNDDTGNLKGVTIDWTLREQKSEEQ